MIPYPLLSWHLYIILLTLTIISFLFSESLYTSLVVLRISETRKSLRMAKDMEKNNQTIEGKVSLPILPEEVSFKGNLNLSCRQIRGTINLTSGAWVGLEGKGLVRVNSCLYNLKYYDLIPSDSTQKKVIQKGLKQILPKTPPQTPTTPPRTTKKHTPDEELKQVELIGRLVKKVSSFTTRRETLKKTKEEDKLILLIRQQKKDLTLIEKYLSTLKQDICFSITDKFYVYKGEFASCKRLIPEGGF